MFTHLTHFSISKAKFHRISGLCFDDFVQTDSRRGSPISDTGFSEKNGFRFFDVFAYREPIITKVGFSQDDCRESTAAVPENHSQDNGFCSLSGTFTEKLKNDQEIDPAFDIPCPDRLCRFGLFGKYRLPNHAERPNPAQSALSDRRHSILPGRA